jgi:hypothetical protein
VEGTGHRSGPPGQQSEERVHTAINRHGGSSVVGVESVRGKGTIMRGFYRLVVAIGFAGALTAIPATAASAHVHGITPLRCTPAPANAGANQTDETPASAANGGPISGVIPITMGGNVTLFGEGFDAAVCSP